MRVVLYIVLAVNAAYLYLNVEHWRKQAPTQASTFAFVKQLVLISEAAADELRPRHQPPPARPDEPVVADSSDESNVEQTTPDADASAPTTSEGDAPLTTAALKLTCYSVGPLTDANEQQAVASWLTEQGAHAELREDERRELARYWVHLAPLDSLDAAKAQLAALRDAGIDDLHVIRRGNMANAISLGLYSRKTHLERRVAKLEKVGIAPQVQERYRTYKSSWFDVVTPADSPFSDEALAERFPAVESRTRACGDSKESPKATG